MKAFILSLFLAFAGMSGMAYAQDVCFTPSQALEVAASVQGAQVVVLDGENAQLARDYIDAKFGGGEGNIVEFDSIILMYDPSGIVRNTGFSVAFKEGCSVAKAPIANEDIEAIIKITGSAPRSA